MYRSMLRFCADLWLGNLPDLTSVTRTSMFSVLRLLAYLFVFNVFNANHIFVSGFLFFPDRQNVINRFENGLKLVFHSASFRTIDFKI